MPLETKIASKLITQLQQGRDLLEQAGDAAGAANITTAIASVVMASEESQKEPPTEDQIDELKRLAALTPDFYRKSLYANDLTVKLARLAAFGRVPLVSAPRQQAPIVRRPPIRRVK